MQRTELSAGVRHIQVRYASNGSYSAWFEYLHRDHLGSVAVVTNAVGTQLIDKLSYDPFGGRRRDTWASDITTTGMNSILANEDVRFARGFTDHEMLNRTGFIHMNGRVYDPRIGRFVSADPIVQAPFHSQSYNRYAYVFNSPLSSTDPSGFVIRPNNNKCIECYGAGVFVATLFGAPPLVAGLVGSLFSALFGGDSGGSGGGTSPALTGMASVGVMGGGAVDKAKKVDSLRERWARSRPRLPRRSRWTRIGRVYHWKDSVKRFTSRHTKSHLAHGTWRSSTGAKL